MRAYRPFNEMVTAAVGDAAPSGRKYAGVDHHGIRLPYPMGARRVPLATNPQPSVGPNISKERRAQDRKKPRLATGQWARRGDKVLGASSHTTSEPRNARLIVAGKHVEPAGPRVKWSLRRQSAEDDRIHVRGNRLGPHVVEEVVGAFARLSLKLAPATVASDEDGARFTAKAAADKYLFRFVHCSN